MSALDKVLDWEDVGIQVSVYREAAAELAALRAELAEAKAANGKLQSENDAWMNAYAQWEKPLGGNEWGVDIRDVVKANAALGSELAEAKKLLESARVIIVDAITLSPRAADELDTRIAAWLKEHPG